MAEASVQVGTNVVVASYTLPVVSRPVDMGNANAVRVNYVVHSISGGVTLSLAIEGSNDAVNWATVVTTISIGAGASSTSADSIPWKYVRLTYLLSGSGMAMLSAGVSTSTQ